MWYSAASGHSSWGLSHESGMRGDEVMQNTRRSALETLQLPSGWLLLRGIGGSSLLMHSCLNSPFTILPIQSGAALVLPVHYIHTAAGQQGRQGICQQGGYHGFFPYGIRTASLVWFFSTWNSRAYWSFCWHSSKWRKYTFPSGAPGVEESAKEHVVFNLPSE